MRASAVWLDVIPSMRGFGAELAKQGARAGSKTGKALGDALEKAAERAGRDAGKVLAANVENAKDRVQEAAKAIVKARDAEADAAGKVTIAQAKLDELNQKGRKTAAQLAVATERLGAANRRLLAAQRDVTQATEEDERAKAALTAATADLDKETANSGQALVRLSRNLKRIDPRPIDRVARSMRNYSLAAYTAASATALLGGTVPVVAGLATILAQASGAALLVPGALALGGVALTAFAVGVSGVGAALQEWDDPEKFAEAIKNLSGEAQRFAIAVRDLRPELIGLRNAVQGALFAGAEQDVKALAGVYLPLLRSGLVGVATELARARREVVGFATDAATIRDVGTMFGDTSAVTANLTAAVRPLLDALRDIGVVGTGVLVDVTAGAGDLARNFAAFIAEARASGSLDEWMQTGLQALRDLGTLLANLGSIFYSVFRAANEQGGSLLDSMNAVTGSVAAMLSSVEGRETLNVFFRTLHDIVQNLQPGLRAVMGAIGDGIQVLGPSLPPVAKAFSDVAIAVSPLITDLAALASSILPPIARVVSTLAPELAALAAAFVAGRIALAAYNAVVVGVLAVQRIVGMVKAWAAAQWALNTAMAANVIGLVVVAVAALIAGVIYLWRNHEGFRNFFINAWSLIKQIVVATWEVYLKPAFLAIADAALAVADAAVWLWQKMVAAAEAIGSAAMWLWRNVLAPFFSFIDKAVRIAAAVIITLLVTPGIIAFNLLADAAMWLWQNGIRPSFEAIGTAATWLWQNVLKPFVDLNVASFRLVAGVALWLYANGIKPTFDAIGVIVGWVIDRVVWYFNLWVAAVQVVATAVQLALSAIGEFFTWLWETKISPFLSWIMRQLEILGQAFTILWSDWVRPALESIGRLVQFLWDNTIGRVFGLIREGADSVGRSFDSVVGWIERAWGRLREILAKPVNFMINTVYNDGLRAVFNKVAEFVDIPGLPPIPEIKFAGGGIVPGYAPGRDIVPALLSPGEAVLVPEAVRLLGARNILALNASVSGRRATVVGGGYSGGGLVHRFAGGGVIGSIASWVGGLAQSIADLFNDPAGFVRSRIGGGAGWLEQLALMPAKVVGKLGDALWSKIKGFFGFSSDEAAASASAAGGRPQGWQQMWEIIRTQFPSAILTSSFRPGDPGYHGKGRAIDIAGPMSSINSWIARVYPNSTQLIYTPGVNILNGRPFTYDAPTQADHHDHVHWAFDSGGYLMPGVSTVYNGTGRPEPVLTPSQWDSLRHNGSALSGPVAITGTLHLGDGFEARIDGRIVQAQQQTGAAIAARRRF